MGYNEAYLNLLSQQAARRAQNLRDVANIGAQAQMASAEAWGRVPGTLAAIGTRFAGDILDYKAKQDQNRIQEAKNQEAAKEAKARTALEMWKIGAPYVGRVLETVTPENWAQSRAMAKDFAASVGQDALVDKHWPEQYSPQAEQQIKAFASVIGEKGKEASELTQALDAKARSIGTTRDKLPYDVWMGVAKEFEATKRAPERPVAGGPGTIYRDPADLSKIVAENPAAPVPPASPMRLPNTKDPATGKFGTLLVDPTTQQTVGFFEERPPQASQAGGQSAPATGFVLETPPDETNRNKLAPGGTLTQKAVWDQAENYLLTGERNYNQRSADAKEKANAANIINTASARINDESSLPILRTTYKSLSGSQQQMTKAYLATTAFVESARRGIRQAEALSDTYPRTGMPAANEVKRWWDRNISGDPNLSAFEVFVYNTVRDYGKATSGSAQSIAQMTDAQIKAAEMLLGTAHSPAQFKAAVSSLDRDMVNILDTQRERIAQTQTDILGLLDQSFGKPAGARTPQVGQAPAGRGGAAPPPASGRSGQNSTHYTGPTPPVNPQEGWTWQSPTGLTKRMNGRWMPVTQK